MTESTLTDKDLLLQLQSPTLCCKEIVQQILDDMQAHLFSVGEAMKNKENPIPAKPVLYRWWFPEDSAVCEVIREHGKDILGQAEKRTIDGRLYYALYFGKSNKGSRRYNQHTEGTVGNSTIRHTVYGLCIGGEYDPKKEEIISDILNECYCEWVAIEGPNAANLIGCFESMCIALGHYPLNVDGNPAISEDWRRRLLAGRKESKKERK